MRRRLALILFGVLALVVFARVLRATPSELGAPTGDEAAREHAEGLAFYGAAAQVIPVLLLAVVFEMRDSIVARTPWVLALVIYMTFGEYMALAAVRDGEDDLLRSRWSRRRTSSASALLARTF